jgi:hypothetical protein
VKLSEVASTANQQVRQLLISCVTGHVILSGFELSGSSVSSPMAERRIDCFIGSHRAKAVERWRRGGRYIPIPFATVHDKHVFRVRVG